MKEDRLSSLMECLLLHILSFLDAKEAVRTCILSTRWKNLWKILPSITLSFEQFKTLDDFTNFVSRILSLRDASTTLQALDFRCKNTIELHLLERILEYAVSHNIHRLRINFKCVIPEFPSSLFSCNTLSSLDLSVNFNSHTTFLPFPDSLNFPVITNLVLQGFSFCVGNNGRVDPFSAFKMLDTLIIQRCIVQDKRQNLCISSATLVNLTLRASYPWTRINFHLYTPNLCTFVYGGHIPFQNLCGGNTNLFCVKHVNLDLYISVGKWSIPADNPLFLINLLIELPNIESLSVSSRTLKVLSLTPSMFEVKFPALYNLKTLKLKASSVSEGMVNFFLQNAPSAKVDVISQVSCNLNRVHRRWSRGGSWDAEVLP